MITRCPDQGCPTGYESKFAAGSRIPLMVEKFKSPLFGVQDVDEQTYSQKTHTVQKKSSISRALIGSRHIPIHSVASHALLVTHTSPLFSKNLHNQNAVEAFCRSLQESCQLGGFSYP